MDQSQSLNIFFRGTSGKDLSATYFEAWEMGLKTTYYLRTLGASQVEKSTVSTNAFGTTHTRASGDEISAVKAPQQMIQEIRSSIEAVPAKEQIVIIKANQEGEDCESCQA